MRSTALLGRAGLVALALSAPFVGCGNDSAPSPFDDGAAGAAGEGPDAGSDADSDAGSDPTLGGPCSDEGQCDDGVDCTVDRCDLEIGRCRFEPDHSLCADDIYCDGEEQCQPGLGCREGEPVSCTDFDPCTIDRCVEETEGCMHAARDADGDGDPVRNCEGGADCDDQDPSVSSQAEERCDNAIDDDCDGDVDEDDCVRPEHDTCVDALEIEAAGSYALKFAGARDDYALSCEIAKISKTFRDLVVAVIVPEGDPVDVDITATAPSGNLVLASASQCGESSSETQCTTTNTEQGEAPVARMKLRSVEPGAHAVYVASSSETLATLDVRYTEPSTPPTNETCGTAATIEPEQHVLVSLVGVLGDVSSACEREVGDLFYRFELAEPSDVSLRAVSLDDLGAPVLSLRGTPCAKEERTCRGGGTADLFARALPAGEYFVAVSGTGPTDLDLVLEVDPPSDPLAGEGCGLPLELEPGGTDVDFAGRPDAVQIGCLIGAPDATFALEVEEPSDVLLLGRLSDDDTGALLLADAACSSSDSVRVCRSSESSPLRAVSYAVTPGDYRVVAESSTGKPMSVVALLRPSRAATLVAFADECASAVKIPESGGRFEGNTANQYADYDASCDQGGGEPGGAPDQVLRLDLEAERRVILDMRGSDFDTLLSVRRGPDCPGTEVTLGCSTGKRTDRSFLDLTLEAGTYYVQIDGFDGKSGRWVLDVFIEDPG
jgi:hypothetical protein